LFYLPVFWRVFGAQTGVDVARKYGDTAPTHGHWGSNGAWVGPDTRWRGGAM
jgi:hypothetical protein